MEEKTLHLLTEDEAAKLKKRETEILSAFVMFCNKNNLKYFMFAGSLLGTVRHKGFIPWDDDVDVCMPREDYERLQKMDKDAMGPNYFIQSYISDKEYALPYMKIRDNNSVFLENSVYKTNIHHGIFLDIFPLNGIPSSKIGRFFYNAQIYRFNVIINKRFNVEKENSLKKAIKGFLAFRYRKKSVIEVVEMKDKYISKHQYPDSKLFACGPFSFETIFAKKDFSSSDKGLFEGIEVSIPCGWDNILKSHYGDYMTPPPIEKRITNHPIVDFKIW